MVNMLVSYLSMCLTVVLHTRIRYSPGRFSAFAEMKALLAHIVVTYAVKLEEGKIGHTRVLLRCCTYPWECGRVV